MFLPKIVTYYLASLGAKKVTLKYQGGKEEMHILSGDDFVGAAEEIAKSLISNEIIHGRLSERGKTKLKLICQFGWSPAKTLKENFEKTGVEWNDKYIVVSVPNGALGGDTHAAFEVERSENI